MPQQTTSHSVISAKWRSHSCHTYNLNVTFHCPKHYVTSYHIFNGNKIWIIQW
jgi:hypothetical protein